MNEFENDIDLPTKLLNLIKCSLLINSKDVSCGLDECTDRSPILSMRNSILNKLDLDFTNSTELGLILKVKNSRTYYDLYSSIMDFKNSITLEDLKVIFSKIKNLADKKIEKVKEIKSSHNNDYFNPLFNSDIGFNFGQNLPSHYFVLHTYSNIINHLLESNEITDKEERYENLTEALEYFIKDENTQSKMNIGDRSELHERNDVISVTSVHIKSKLSEPVIMDIQEQQFIEIQIDNLNPSMVSFILTQDTS